MLGRKFKEIMSKLEGNFYEVRIIEHAGSSKQHLQWTRKRLKVDVEGSWV